MNGRFAHLSQRWQDCITAYEQTSPSHHIREDYRAYLGGLFAQKSPDEITAQDVQDYALSPSRRGLPIKDAARRQRISVPSKFYEFSKQYIPPGESAPITTRNPTRELLPSGDLPRLVSHVKKEPFTQLAPAWRSCVQDFLLSIKNISGSEESLIRYRDTLRRFFDMFPAISPGDMTRQECIAFINRPSVSALRFGQEVSAQTKNSRSSTLSSFYKWASIYLVDGQPLYQKASPLAGYRTLKTGMNPRALSDEETRRFFAAIDRSDVKGRRTFCIFYLFWISGRRRLEIVRLRWGDLSQTTFVDDSGNSRPGWQFTYIPKGNSRQKKTRELPESAVSLILDYLQFSGRLATIKPEDPLFAPVVLGRGRRAGSHNETLSPQYVYQEFKRIAALAGIPRSATLHSMRHSAAHVRYALTRDIVKVSEFLGHTNIGTTHRYILSIVTPQDTDSKLIEAKYAYLLAQPGSEALHV